MIKLFYIKLINEGIRSREIEHPDFQSNLRVKLFNNKQIHRADFSMTFNNMLRTNAVKQLLE